MKIIAGFPVHPYTNQYPLMRDIDPEGFERFVEDMKANGLTERIEIVGHKGGAKMIIEGRNRALALERLGIKIDPDKYMTEKRFSTEAGLRAYIDSKNLHRRHLTKEWRDNILAQLIKDNPDVSDRGVAAKAAQVGVKVDKNKVARQRSKMEGRGAVAPRQIITDTKGRKQPSSKTQKPQSPVLQSNSVEIYTPARYIEAARKVLETIDLDPASSEEANQTVRALKFYDAQSNGLKNQWRGRVWLNPPYNGGAQPFIEKLMDSIAAKSVTAAIVCLNSNSTDSKWFRPLWKCVLCFSYDRISFSGATANTHGTVFVYFGPHPDAFAHHFRQFGAVVSEYEETASKTSGTGTATRVG